MELRILQFIIAFIVPVALALVLTPWVMKFAGIIGALDKPNARKVHTKVTPRLGGAVIYLSIALTSVFAFLFFNFQGLEFAVHYQKVILIGVALTLVFLLGVWDDITPLKPGLKFALQIGIASIVYFAGVKISTIMNPLSAYTINVQLIDYPLTILWIVGVTNAINLIDGLDGLASGVATIASVSIFSVSAYSGEFGNAYIALILAGSLVGFLRYNFNPAKIFLGDSGSLLLGFLLAILSIQSPNKVSTGFSILFPILVLGFPLTDTAIAMLRRFLSSFLENGSTKAHQGIKGKLYKMFLPDKSHIHHQLLAQGLTHRNTVIVLYIISAFFAFTAFSISMLSSFKDVALAVTAVLAILFFGIKKLKYREINVLHNGIFLPLYERFWTNKFIFKSLFDLSFISFSFIISFFVLKWSNPELVVISKFQPALLSAIVFQLFVLWVSGLYRESGNNMGLGDALKITKCVAYASLSLIPLFFFYFEFSASFLTPFIILNFYLLITFILGFRISYQTLRYLFFRTQKSENRVIIFGANKFGQMLLDQIMTYKEPKFNVLGFIDEDPELEGTYLNGFQVFGGHWKLKRLFKSSKFDMILLTDTDIKPEVFKRIKAFSREKNIPVLKFNLDFEDLTDVKQMNHERSRVSNLLSLQLDTI